MHRRSFRTFRIVLLTMLALAQWAAPPCAAAAAELSLDRAAVQDLLAATIPSSLDVELRGLGSVTLELGQPTRSDFVDGAVETTLPVRIVAAGLAGDVLLRLVPEIEPLHGTPLLRATTARFEPAGLDVAEWLPPVALPRRADWTIPAATSNGGTELAVTCFVQAITVEPDRLRLELGLRVRTAPTNGTDRAPAAASR